MPVDWTSAAANTRLLSAVLAAHDFKSNHKEIAKYYGKDATPSAVERQFRRFRSHAEELKTAFETGGEASDLVLSTRASKPKAKGLNLGGVRAGRVAKKASGAKKSVVKTKKDSKMATIKSEAKDEGDEMEGDGDVDRGEMESEEDGDVDGVPMASEGEDDVDGVEMASEEK